MRHPDKGWAGGAPFSFRFFGSCFGTRNCGCRTLRGFRRVRFFHAAINLGLLTFRFSKHIRWKQPASSLFRAPQIRECLRRHREAHPAKTEVVTKLLWAERG